MESTAAGSRTPTPGASLDIEAIERARPMLVGAAARIVGSVAGAEDVVQDAIVTALRHAADFRGQSQVRTWLYRIVVNRALEVARRARRRGEVSIDALQPEYVNGMHARLPASLETVTTGAVAGVEDRARLLGALARLPAEFAEVIVMKDVHGLASAEIAGALGISDALVRQRVHRGRLALAEMLARGEREDRP